jgi:predicted dehydrogenase
MKDKFGYGIVGCGVIAPWHARAVKNLPNADLVAVCDIDLPKAEKLRDDFGAQNVYADYEELLAREDIDVISICTPSGHHHEVAIAAAKAGKHVLSEKPLDVTHEHMDAMIEACRDADVKLACIFQRRTSKLWQLVKQAVEEQRFGKVILGSAYIKYFRSQEYYDSAGWRGTWALDGGGALMNQCVHLIDLFRWIMGPVDTIFGFADHLARKIEVEDTCVASVKFASGAFGTMEGTTSTTPGLKHRIEIHGENGTIRVEGESIVSWDVPGENKDEMIAQLSDGVGDAASDPTAIAGDGHQMQIADLLDAIKDGREPMVNGEEARKAVEFILAVYKSAQTGLPVRP